MRCHDGPYQLHVVDTSHTPPKHLLCHFHLSALYLLLLASLLYVHVHCFSCSSRLIGLCQPLTLAAPLSQAFHGADGRLTHASLIGESMKRPAVTDSVSDIFELDDSQPMQTTGHRGQGGHHHLAANVHQAQAHRHDQYLQHNCNPRQNHNAMSIETDV